MNGFYLAIGKQGSGKTLFITRLLVDNLKGRKVFSNYSLFGIDYTKVTLARDLSDKTVPRVLDMLKDDPNVFNDSILLLDEIHIDLNSLDFMRKSNRALQVFFSQLRKRNILLLATSQYLLNVDIRIRRQCKNVFEMTNIQGSVFQVVTHEIDGYYSQEVSRVYVDLKDYYHYYDTFEIVL